MTKHCELAEVPEVLDLGRTLGRREAFSAIAGRCSAAEAVQMSRIRYQKSYTRSCRTWSEFCRVYLHMSRSNADRIINLLEEFGEDYFVLAQLTRISPETYRAIAPAIQQNTLIVRDEKITLLPENAERIAVAVAELRKNAPFPPIMTPQERMADLEEQWADFLIRFEALAREWHNTGERGMALEMLNKMRLAVMRLEPEV